MSKAGRRQTGSQGRGKRMNEQDSRRQEIMRELAERFKNSSEIMRMIAKRIGDAAETHNANRKRLEMASSPLRKCVEVNNSGMPFSYREFVEFTNAAEFERFRNLEPITAEEVETVDWDALAKGLLEE